MTQNENLNKLMKVEYYLVKLDKTPKWRVLKRRQLKRTINYWGRQG